VAITPSSLSVRVRQCFVQYIYYLTIQGARLFLDSQLILRSSDLHQSPWVHVQRGLGF
jgi:hypothetical protein